MVWLRKHGVLDWSTPQLYTMENPRSKEVPTQKIKRLEKALADERLKNEILSKMIDVSDQQYGISIRKKYLPKQSEASKKAKGKLIPLLQIVWDKQAGHL